LNDKPASSAGGAAGVVKPEKVGFDEE